MPPTESKRRGNISAIQTRSKRRGNISATPTRSKQRISVSATTIHRSKLPSESLSVPRKWDPDKATAEDIHNVRDILRTLGFPLEIVFMILNFAEYWYKQQFTRNVPLELEAGVSLSYYESSALYLQTGPLGYGDFFDLLPVARPSKVVFRIVSRDSGQGSDFAGTYQHQTSWFDASIFREDESWTGNDKDRQEPIQVLERGLKEDGVLELLENWGRGGAAMERGELAMWYVGHNPNVPPKQLAPDGINLIGGFKFVKNTHWLIQRNLRAGEEFLEHKIEWKSESAKDTGVGKYSINGAGSGKNFVNTLRRGDRIGVWARTFVST